MSVNDCQQMIMDDDYLMICRGKRSLINIGAKKAYIDFIKQLRSLFGGDSELAKMIDLDIMLQGMRFKIDFLRLLMDKFNWCYSVRDTPAKIKSLDKAKEYYRTMFFDYPKSVDCITYTEEMKLSKSELKEYHELQSSQVKAALKPIVDKIRLLQYKIKEHAPKIDNEPIKKENQKGLELHIAFIEAMNPEKGYLDRNIPVSSLADKYNHAVEKNNKLKHTA